MPVAAFTGVADSTLAQEADISIDTSVEREACPLGLAPTASTTLALAVGDPQKIEQAMGRPLAGRLASAPDLPAYVTALGERRASDRLEAVLFRAARGAVRQGAVYTPLPPTAAHLLSKKTGGNHSAPFRVAPLAKAVERLDGPVEGGFIVRFEVEPGSGRREN